MNRSRARFIIGCGTLVLGAGVVMGLFFVIVPEQNQRIVDVVLGIVLGWGSAVIAYYFGTSESSSQKTEAMADMADYPRPVEVVNGPGEPVPTTDQDCQRNA